MTHRNYLVWLDLEMTGLDVEENTIIEIATIVTNNQLDIIAKGPDIIIHQPQSALDKMDEWNVTHHGSSGLTKAVQQSTISLKQAEQETLMFLQKHLSPNESPLCGNSIHMDRFFLHRYMPTLHAFFHYRNIDVSTLKELAHRWAPQLTKKLQKQSGHRAMADVEDSIQELRFYRQHFIAAQDTTL